MAAQQSGGRPGCQASGPFDFAERTGLRGGVLRALVLSTTLVAACAHETAAPHASAPFCAYDEMRDGLQSVDILCHEPVSNKVKVRHVLVSWKELATPHHAVDPRAISRTEEQARELARLVLQKVQAGESMTALMAQYSEDPGSAESGITYEVSPEAGMVSQFKSLSLRLQVGQAGIVKSDFGYHIIQRVE